jgi:hypothetical protein
MAETSSPDNIESASKLEDLFSPLEVTILNQVADVAHFRLVARPKKEGETGFATNMRTREIYFDPAEVERMERFRAFAIFGHELGHHFPEVLRLDESFLKLRPIAQRLLPEAYPAKRKLCDALSNILLDVVLEDGIPKHSNIITEELFRAAFRQNRAIMMLENEENGDELIDKFEKSGRAEYPWEDALKKTDTRLSQFSHIALVAPFYSYPDPELLHQDVAEHVPAIQALFNELLSSSLTPEQRAHVYIQFTKIVADLMEKDIDDATEYADDLDEIIKILWENFDKICEKVAEACEIHVHDPEEGNESTSQGKNKKRTPHPSVLRVIEEMQGRLAQVQECADEDEIKKKAELYNVRPNVYAMFLYVKSRFQNEINALRDTLVRFVLRDYKKAIVKGRKEGMMITPGREVETYQRLLTGEHRPATYLDRKNHPSPRAIQLYNLIDTSGSMLTDLDATLAYYLILTMAVLEIQEELVKNRAKYNIRQLTNNPIEIELVGFDFSPLLIIPLAKNVDMYTIMQGFQTIHDEIIDGGATNDARALNFEYSRMKLHKRRVLKVLSMITDGGGQGDAIEPVLRQIEEDPDVYFMVNGVGSSSGLVKKYYQEKFRPAHHYHVYANESDSVEEAIPLLIHFIQDCIRTHFGR